MSEKIYKIIKTVPGTVLIAIHPISNQQLTKLIHLTDRIPQQALPMDWALDVFLDSSLFNLYQRGVITFDDNESLLQAAIENNVYFGEALDFTPAAPDRPKKILEILKSGVRSNILSVIDEYGKDVVFDVAKANVNNLTHNVISMLEGIFKIQLVADGE